MGNDPPIQPAGLTTHKQSETQVLIQASALAEQLKIYNSEQELKEQKHLLARILIYGHSNLVVHLKKFQREQQRQIIRVLRTIDYETTDMLYQNLIVNKLRQAKKPIKYDPFLNLRDKNKQKNTHFVKYEVVCNEGFQAYVAKKVAIILFAGGNSQRFKVKSTNNQSKEFYTEKPQQKCLLEIGFQKLSELLGIKNYLFQLYIVHNDVNHKKINLLLQKYPKVHAIAKKLLQNDSPLVNLSGKMCLKSSEKFQILLAAKGCGDLSNLSVKGVKLFDQMQLCGIEYVYCVGIQNFCAQIGDVYLIGLLSANPSTSVGFKCTVANGESQNLKRVVYNKERLCVLACEYEDLSINCIKTSQKILDQSPVWMGECVFRLKNIKKYLKNKRDNPKMLNLLNAKKIQQTFWNPLTQQYESNQHCYTFQRQMNQFLLNQDLSCIGVLVDRDEQFAPVISLTGQWNWADAYNQYLFRQLSRTHIKRDQQLKESYRSTVNMIEKSEI